MSSWYWESFDYLTKTGGRGKKEGQEGHYQGARDFNKKRYVLNTTPPYPSSAIF